MGFDRLYIWRWEWGHSVTFHVTELFKFSEYFIVDKVSNQDSNNGIIMASPLILECVIMPKLDVNHFVDFLGENEIWKF